mgnify:CR=1 FL=1
MLKSPLTSVLNMGEKCDDGNYSTPGVARRSYFGASVINFYYITLRGAGSEWQKASRWVSVVELHDPALSIGKGFGQESTVVKWNYKTLGLHQVTVPHILGIILVINWFKNWSQQKMLFTKKVRLNWYSSMNFFFGKIRMIFDVENSLWKSKIGTFWQAVTRWRLKIW